MTCKTEDREQDINAICNVLSKLESQWVRNNQTLPPVYETILKEGWEAIRRIQESSNRCESCEDWKRAYLAVNYRAIAAERELKDSRAMLCRIKG